MTADMKQERSNTSTVMTLLHHEGIDLHEIVYVRTVDGRSIVGELLGANEVRSDGWVHCLLAVAPAVGNTAYINFANIISVQIAVKEDGAPATPED